MWMFVIPNYVILKFSLMNNDSLHLLSYFIKAIQTKRKFLVPRLLWACWRSPLRRGCGRPSRATASRSTGTTSTSSQGRPDQFCFRCVLFMIDLTDRVRENVRHKDSTYLKGIEPSKNENWSLRGGLKNINLKFCYAQFL